MPFAIIQPRLGVVASRGILVKKAQEICLLKLAQVQNDQVQPVTTYSWVVQISGQLRVVRLLYPHQGSKEKTFVISSH